VADQGTPSSLNVRPRALVRLLVLADAMASIPPRSPFRCCSLFALAQDPCEIELRKTAAGAVVRMASSRANKTLRLALGRGGSQRVRDGGTGREEMEEAVGAPAAIALLSKAGRSHFCAELFREVRLSALLCSLRIPF